MILALYFVVGAVFATLVWFHAIEHIRDTHFRTRAYVLSWLAMCAGWPLVSLYAQDVIRTTREQAPTLAHLPPFSARDTPLRFLQG